ISVRWICSDIPQSQGRFKGKKTSRTSVTVCRSIVGGVIVIKARIITDNSPYMVWPRSTFRPFDTGQHKKSVSNRTSTIPLVIVHHTARRERVRRVHRVMGHQMMVHHTVTVLRYQ